MNQARGRIVFAVGAAALLAVAGIAVAVSGSGGGGQASDDPCLQVWNDDPVARSDGVHAYEVHGYRETLLARVSPRGELITETTSQPTRQERCTVIFASPRVDDEPDFGVRVHDRGRWAGLALVDQVPLEVIAKLQSDATATHNVTLLPDGRLAD